MPNLRHFSSTASEGRSQGTLCEHQSSALGESHLARVLFAQEFHIPFGKMPADGTYILFEVNDVAGFYERHDICLRSKPVDCDLCRRLLILHAHIFHDLWDSFKKRPLLDWTICDQHHIIFLAVFEKAARFRFPRDEIVIHLIAHDLVLGIALRFFEMLFGEVGYADMLHQFVTDEPVERFHRMFERVLATVVMQKIQVKVAGPEPLKTVFAGPDYVLRRLRVPDFRGDEELFTVVPFHSLPDELFRVPYPIDFSGVYMCDAGFYRRLDSGYLFLIFAKVRLMLATHEPCTQAKLWQRKAVFEGFERNIHPVIVL